MDNQRGIFGLTLFKKVLDYLIFEEFYEDIDENMTDSNIGGRKRRMPKDHLFVLYGVMNSVFNGKEEDINVNIYDIEKAFDKLFLKESLNDMYDNLSESKRNDKLSLLYETNKITRVAIKTPFGLTKRENIEDILQQGGSLGPIKCSNSLDSIGKKSNVDSSRKISNILIKDKQRSLLYYLLMTFLELQSVGLSQWNLIISLLQMLK